MIDADSGFVFPLADEIAPTADHGVAPDKRVEPFMCSDGFELRSAEADDAWIKTDLPVHTRDKR